MAEIDGLAGTRYCLIQLRYDMTSPMPTVDDNIAAIATGKPTDIPAQVAGTVASADKFWSKRTTPFDWVLDDRYSDSDHYQPKKLVVMDDGAHGQPVFVECQINVKTAESDIGNGPNFASRWQQLSADAFTDQGGNWWFAKYAFHPDPS